MKIIKMVNGVETLLICKNRHHLFRQVPKDVIRIIMKYVLGDLNINIVIDWITAQPKISGLALHIVFEKHVLNGMPIGYWPLIRDYAHHLDRLAPRNYHYKRNDTEIYNRVNIGIARWFIPPTKHMLKRLKQTIITYAYYTQPLIRSDKDPRNTNPAILDELLKLMILETSNNLIFRDLNSSIIHVTTNVSANNHGNKISTTGKQKDFSLFFNVNRITYGNCLTCGQSTIGLIATCHKHT